MNMKWLSFLSVLAWVFGTGAQIHAQENRSPITALKAARLFDGKSDELVREGVLLVEGRKIIAAGTRLSIPDGSRGRRSGRRNPLPGIHRRSHAPDRRVQR